MGIKRSNPAPELQIGMVTADADPMMAFYRDTLGFPTKEPLVVPGYGTVHRLVVGECILKVFQPEETPPQRAGPNDTLYASTGLRYITLRVNNLQDLKEVIEECRNFGVEVPDPTEFRPGLFISAFRDPDGNWVELAT